MKIWLISDTHGSSQYLEKLATLLETIQPDLIWHLGDYYEDAEPLIQKGYPTVRVPGTWSDYYQNPLIDNRRIETVSGWRCLLTHTPTQDAHDLPDDPAPELLIQTKQCDLCCHGHTHKPEIRNENGVWVMNPGHLYENDRRGHPPSYGILDINNHTCDATIYELHTGDVVTSGQLSK